MIAAVRASAESFKSRVMGRMSHQRRKGLQSLGWTGMAQFANMAIRLASNLILTRLLAPEIYGVFGTALAILSTIDFLSDLGVQPALIRHPDGERRDFLVTGWWMNAGRGMLIMLVTMAIAYPLSKIYAQPTLLPVLLCLALRPALLGIRSPGFPMLRKNLNYRGIFIDEVGQTVIGTVVSILLAWSTHSIWSIVGGTLAGTLTSLVISYVLCPIFPDRKANPAVVRELSVLGRQVFVNTMIMACWLNLDRLLGLRYLTPLEMGIYTVALNLANVLEVLVGRVGDVYFSILSQQQNHDARQNWHLRACRLTAFRAMPVLAILVVLGPLIISSLYDKRYVTAGIPFALFMAKVMARSLSQIQFQYLLTVQDVRVNTRSYAVSLAVFIACLVPLTRTWGTNGLATTSLVSTIAMTVVQSIFIRQRHGHSLRPLYFTLLWIGLALLALYLFWG